MRKSLSTLALALGLLACSGDTTVTQNPPDDTGVVDTGGRADTSQPDTATPDTAAPDTAMDTVTADTSEPPADTMTADISCATACEAWQTCGEDGQCHDTPCVLGQSALGECVLQ